MTTERKIVPKIEPGMDRDEVLCTTYQMRNPFRQFADCVVSELEVHCWIQHQAAADLCPKGGRVLDVCCGRGLLIPFLRFGKNLPDLYVGVDIHPANAKWKDGEDPRRNGPSETDWKFGLSFIESNVAEMVGPVRERHEHPFDLIVYTSAIEHMHPDHQRASLRACAELAKPDAVLYLTCPVTEQGRSGFQAQYAAHVYEPQEGELTDWLNAAGWKVSSVVGLSTKVTKIREQLSGNQLLVAERMLKDMPRAFALPMLAALFPFIATEKAFICSREVARA